ncbi:MAG TPA: FtsX-like permease family protein, partial [Bryobacteraceae bacterium]|nr:FtsX-like permease family protein [Bryobacteraceae bacterium]
CVLLIVAGLEVRALHHAVHHDPGFDYQHVIAIDPALDGYTPARARVYFDELRGKLRGIPGVESVALATNPPLGNRWTVDNTTIAGRAVNIHFNHVDPPFLQTMQIPILRGRNLASGDGDSAAVVSESLARIRWPSEDPIGKSLRLGKDELRVVGVSRSARLVSPEDSDAVEVYQLAGADLSPMTALVRTSVPPESLVHSVTTVVKSIDPQLLPEVQLMKDEFRGKIQTAEYAALAVSVLGAVAQLLACLGIVGVVAYAVTQRTKEIGIRMALGAKPANILPMILSQFSRPLAAGLVVGVAGAAALSRLLRWQLYGISNLDLAAYLGAIGVFIATAALAALWPARKALRVDPMRALHYE